MISFDIDILDRKNLWHGRHERCVRYGGIHYKVCKNQQPGQPRTILAESIVGHWLDFPVLHGHIIRWRQR